MINFNVNVLLSNFEITQEFWLVSYRKIELTPCTLTVTTGVFQQPTVLVSNRSLHAEIPLHSRNASNFLENPLIHFHCSDARVHRK